jgi:hypothetical protein
MVKAEEITFSTPPSCKKASSIHDYNSSKGHVLLIDTLI